mgnify:CR=1 FL=1
MRPILLKNLLTSKEVFWLYRKLVGLPLWNLTGKPYFDQKDPERLDATIANLTIIKNTQPVGFNGGLDIYGESIPHRINERLKEYKLEIPTAVDRFWINATFSQSHSHWPHHDDADPAAFSIVLFLAPVWNEQWLGSFFCDGEEFKFSPGGAVVFQSTNIHTGDNPSLKCPYLRLTGNIVTRRSISK